MKLLKEFATLEEALKYITTINSAFETLATESEAAKKKLLSLQESLDKEVGITTELKSQNTLLNGAKTSLEVQLETSKAETIEAINELTDLSTKMDLQEKYGKDGLVVTIKGEGYTLIGDTFTYGGSNKTAEELSKDKPQLEQMVAKQSGALVKIIKS